MIGIADEVDNLVLALIENASSPRRVLAVAGQIAVLPVPAAPVVWMGPAWSTSARAGLLASLPA